MTTKMDIYEAINQLSEDNRPDSAPLITLLRCSDEELKFVCSSAESLRRKYFGNTIHLRAILEFSNFCRKNCSYCGIRRENKNITRYRMKKEDIVNRAIEIEKFGYKTIVMQSGEDTYYTKDLMAEVIREIKEKTDLAMTLSLGERDYETYQAWKEAGADRYLLRIETTDENLFRSVHPDDSLAYRMECLMNLKHLGYQLGTGVQIGLPGQTDEILAHDIQKLYDIGVEMIGSGPFVPHPDTPLGGESGGTFSKTIRFFAAARLVFPTCHIPATTAIGAIQQNGREAVLSCGANVLMLNLTPESIRGHYELYPGKIFKKDDGRNSLEAVVKTLEKQGLTVSTGHGHVWRLENNR